MAVFLVAAWPASGRDTNAEVAVGQCLKRLEQAGREVEALWAAASNDVTRAACVEERVNALRGLQELARSLAAGLEATGEEETELAGALQSKIILACERAEKLLAEARGCGEAVLPVKKRRRVIAVEAPEGGGRPRVAMAGTVVRDATTCLRQGGLARLVWEAMERPAAEDEDSMLAALGRDGIAPLGGWEAHDCVTVDDVCRVACQMMGVKVDRPDDSYQWVVAARREGLGVDALLPRRRRDADAPLVLPAEARAFFAYGLAAVLPSSRRVPPP